MSEVRRPVLRRLGIVALNLPQPGLGLLRIGRLRPALVFLFAPSLAMGLLIAFYVVAPTLTFTGYAVTSALILAIATAAYLGSMWLSWRWSAVRQEPKPWWSRWYGILGMLILAGSLAWPLSFFARTYYEPFYVPAESMSPTLLKGDRLLAYMRMGELRRGEIVIIEVGEYRYVKRLVALPGDMIAMRDGQVILNGRPVEQRLLGLESVAGYGGPVQARRLAEQFPGEVQPHHIYDIDFDPRVDEMAEVRVAPGHVFVLGDNRDRSADSRVSRAMAGVEQLPVNKVLGRVLFQTWNPDGTIARPLR